MERSRFWLSMQRIVLEILEENPAQLYSDWISGKVVRVNSDGTVDVNLEDVTQRLATVSRAKIVAGVGETVEVTAGTRVSIGWLQHDERYPIAVHTGWLGAGGLKSRSTLFSDLFEFVRGTSVKLRITDKIRAQKFSGANPQPVVRTTDIIELPANSVIVAVDFGSSTVTLNPNPIVCTILGGSEVLEAD